MNKIDEAIDLYRKAYGKTPKSLGFTEISVYEKQRAFLYAKSLAAIEAYKTQQNIVRWMMTWFVWPIAVVFLVWLVTLAKSTDAMHPLCIACYIFYGVWVVLALVLGIIAKKADKRITLGKNITFLNYSK